MKILAFEFSSEERSVALGQAAGGFFQLLSQASERGGRSTRAISLVESVLAKAKLNHDEIECLAMGIGPGSYTGIRAGIALAQGWQLARPALKTIGISSIECLAHRAHAEGLRGCVSIVIDAQRNDFYCATYDLAEAGFSEIKSICLVPAVQIEELARAGNVIAGPDADRFGGRTLFPDAGSIGRLASGKTAFVPANQLEPIYLREISFVKAPPSRTIGNITP